MILINKASYAEIIEHAKLGVPNEVCGYLAGKEEVITKVYKMMNASETPKTFFNFDIREMFKVQKESRLEGLRFLGVYHSHPVGGNKPSVSDKEYLKDPNLNYIIISLENGEPEVKGFWIKNGESGPLEIQIKD